MKDVIKGFCFFIYVLGALCLLGVAWASSNKFRFPPIPRSFPEGYSQTCFLIRSEARKIETVAYKQEEADLTDEGWISIPEEPPPWWQRWDFPPR